MTTFLAEIDFMGTIFLSHSSQNNFEAIALRDWLASEGWDDVFLDLDPERGIKAGERWQDALKRASANCELVLFLISPAWVCLLYTSGRCRRSYACSSRSLLCR